MTPIIVAILFAVALGVAIYFYLKPNKSSSDTPVNGGGGGEGGAEKSEKRPQL